MKGTCATCRWRNGTYCQRFPPSVVQRFPGHAFPEVELSDWCGEHQTKGDEEEVKF